MVVFITPDWQNVTRSDLWEHGRACSQCVNCKISKKIELVAAEACRFFNPWNQWTYLFAVDLICRFSDKMTPYRSRPRDRGAGFLLFSVSFFLFIYLFIYLFLIYFFFFFLFCFLFPFLFSCFFLFLFNFLFLVSFYLYVFLILFFHFIFSFYSSFS
jgi:hypothetical protein